MLINALCDYYDILSKAGKVLPEGYSSVKIHYIISLTPEGEVDDIIDWQKKELVLSGKKEKERKVPRDCQMPQRTEKPGIEANIIEHRSLYIFGLNLENNQFTPTDRTNKAQKSHEAFVKASLDCTEGLESPVVSAFRNFLLKWKPEEQTENPHLLRLGKDYGKSGFAFCLSGEPDCLLHEDRQIKQKWEEIYSQKQEGEENGYVSQCAVTGENARIARIHSKIKGVYGGLATGSVLIGFNNPSENSYGNEQSYNSNISETAMKKYTEALNYLLAGNTHKAMLDEMTIVFWAMDEKEEYESLFARVMFGQTDEMGAEKTEKMLKELLEDSRKGKVAPERLKSIGLIGKDVDFYMLGLKPNSSRLSVKFIFRRKYADVLWNIARFQQELQITKELRPVSLPRIKMELISPKSKNEKINPALASALFQAVIYGGPYPAALLETVVRRVKKDDVKVNAVRAGIIKACLNRNFEKEELKVALDKENQGQAYLCGRLFAVLEKLQQEASNNSLNRTIKDSYFASAASKPVLVFPKLITLAQNHLKKVKYPGYYNRLIGEITNGLNGGFPDNLLLKEQGEFIVGYYQQYQSFFEPSEKKEEMEEK